MKRLVVVMALLLTACAPAGEGQQPGNGLERFVDPSFRVVCYQRFPSNAPLSCVSY